MTKNTRAGGKYTGNHTTLIPAAAIVCDIANKCVHVAKISPGFIKAGLRPPREGRRVKIEEKEGSFLLTVRDITSQQEVHVYTSDREAAKRAISDGAQNEGLAVIFRKK